MGTSSGGPSAGFLSKATLSSLGQALKLRDTQAAQGAQQYGFGTPVLGQATGYYQRLLSGNRAETTAAVAPEASAISDVYAGAQRGLARSAPGPLRDVATADLNRERAGKIAGLVAGVRPGAASALTQIGEGAIGRGMGGTAGAAGTTLDAAGRIGSLFQTQSQAEQAKSGSAGQGAGKVLSTVLAAK